MQVDTSRMPSDTEIRSDVCVVGAGPAGITLARELDGTGVDVCLIESGGEDVEPSVQRQSRGESDGYPIHRLHRSRTRAFGGTMRHRELDSEDWAARPLDALDFEARPGVPDSGWPFDREHLETHYRRAQVLSGLGPYGYQPEPWARDGAWPLGMDGTGVDTTVFHFGRPVFHHALEQIRASGNVRLLLRTRVVDLSTGDDGRIEKVVIGRPDGSRLGVRARVVVLAAGGIENARLLLSADGMRGLGNEHDLVGRYFAERLSTHAGHVVVPDPATVGPGGFYEIRRVRDALVRGALRVSDTVQRDRELLNCVFFMVPRPAAVTTDAVRSLAALRKATVRRPLPPRTGAHLGNVVRGVRDIGGFAAGRFRPTETRIVLRAQGEPAPDRESRVSLGRRRDDLGIPVARVTWKIDESGLESIVRSLDIVDAAVRAGGIGFVEKALGHDGVPPLMEGNHHHLGTTRMHADPKRGVVNAECRVHSVPNLYVTGSSVFPTYGASNPTLTIVALAARLAAHLRVTLTRSSTAHTGQVVRSPHSAPGGRTGGELPRSVTDVQRSDNE